MTQIAMPRTPHCRLNAFRRAWELAREAKSDVYVHRRGEEFVVTRDPIRVSQVTGDMCEFTVVTAIGTMRGYSPEVA